MKQIEVNGESVPVNNQYFVLVTNPNASFEDYGWTEEYVEELLELEEYEPDGEDMNDPGILNDLGIIYSDAVGVERNMAKAVTYFKKAATLDNDLARSNLADIYRKGSYGVPVNHTRAFELYQACKLPYAYYRVGEYYETGLAGVQDIELAKRNYRIAYKEGHGLAHKKLKTFDFLS